MHNKTAMRERNRKGLLQSLSPELAGKLSCDGQRWIREQMTHWVKHASTGFLSQLVVGMGCQAYAPREMIASANNMYILKHGTVCNSVLMTKASKKTVWNTDFNLTPLEIRHMTGSRTITYVEVDVLSREHFFRVLDEGFEEERTIRKDLTWFAALRALQAIAQKRHENIRKLREKEKKMRADLGDGGLMADMEIQQTLRTRARTNSMEAMKKANKKMPRPSVSSFMTNPMKAIKRRASRASLGQALAGDSYSLNTPEKEKENLVGRAGNANTNTNITDNGRIIDSPDSSSGESPLSEKEAQSSRIMI